VSSPIRYPNATAGLGLDHTDANFGRDIQRIVEGDMRLGALLHRASPYDFIDPSPHLSVAYCSGVGGFPYPHASTARRIRNAGGLIHQYTSTAVPNGTTPVLLSYWLESDELLSELTVGDATNPRIDLIEYKLDVLDESESRDYKDNATGVVTTTSGVTRKKIRMTRSVTIGTPSATPALPTGTAGYVPWCYVWVPATHNAVFTDLHLSDMRIPLGYQRPLVMASVGAPVTAGDWPLTTVPTATFGARQSGGAGEDVIFLCPTLDAGVRILKIHIHASANVDVEVGYLNMNAPGVGSSLGVFTNTRAVTPPSPGGSVVPSATKPMAWWANGLGHGSSLAFGEQDVNGLFVRVEALGASTELYGVSFELAGTV
jgi:hypothetical protein